MATLQIVTFLNTGTPELSLSPFPDGGPEEVEEHEEDEAAHHQVVDVAEQAEQALGDLEGGGN